VRGLSSDCLQIIEASVSIIAFAIYWLSLRRRPGLTPLPPDYPSSADFRKAVEGLPDECKAAETFSKSAADLFKTFRESSAAFDSKLGSVLGFVAGGSGVLALLSTTDKVARPTLSPLLLLAVVALVAVFVCAFEGLRPQERRNPDVAQLVDAALMGATNGNSRMNALMGWQNLDAARQLVAIVAYKSRWLKRCYGAFALGIFALVLNAITPVPAASSAVTTTKYTVPVSCISPPRHDAYQCTITTMETKK
jgi:hypothetical protein